MVGVNFMEGGYALPTNPKKVHSEKYRINNAVNPSGEPNSERKCMRYGPGQTLNKFVKHYKSDKLFI